ncbi:MarR family winged helix-turn-helix transcriptional regulator [Nonomuraea spiralis]|uniref:MarR family winged helix-turn-helix transcriptional regulator n=1 Tax=Nonomuraea spiralis TaxID=46182 RepID=A0ABV5IBC4_9ACTN|nr:MarR family transcriptional regulator [Nonomuraea spiralis]
MVATEAPGLSLTEALVRLAHLVQQVYGDVSREHDLTPQQAQLLCLLVDGPIGMSGLTRALHLEKSSLTGLVDRAEKRGLVARVRDARDRRACLIELTGAGAEIATRAHDGVAARLETLAAGLPARQRELLTGVVGAILAEDAARTGRTWSRPEPEGPVAAGVNGR